MTNPSKDAQSVEQKKNVSSIELALKVAKECMYADEMTDGAKGYLISLIDTALRDYHLSQVSIEGETISQTDAEKVKNMTAEERKKFGHPSGDFSYICGHDWCRCMQ